MTRDIPTYERREIEYRDDELEEAKAVADPPWAAVGRDSDGHARTARDGESVVNGSIRPVPGDVPTTPEEDND